jgi:hypothetical protein
MHKYAVGQPPVVRGLAIGLAISLGIWSVLAFSVVAISF